MADTSNKTDVLIVGHSLSRGGAERFTSNLLCKLDRSRFRLRLLLLEPDITYPLPQDVGLDCLPAGTSRSWFRSVRGVRRTLLRSRPDVVISTMLNLSRLVSVARRTIRRPPRWIAREATDVGRGAAWKRRIHTRLLTTADQIVFNSEGNRRSASSLYRNVADRLVTISNPTDFAQLDILAAQPADVPTTDRQVILAAARLIPAKRPDVMLAAFARLHRHVRAELWFCGDGPLEGQLRRDAADLGLAHAVRFLGFQSNPYAFMQRADVFLLTSDFEGMPNALIEAQGLGLPAVATHCPHGPDEVIVDGVTGRLVPRANPNETAAALQALLSDPSRAMQMGAAAAEHVRNMFGGTQIIRRWEMLLAGERSSATTRRAA